MGNFKAISQFAPVYVTWHQAQGILPGSSSHSVFVSDGVYEVDRVEVVYAVAGGATAAVRIRKPENGAAIGTASIVTSQADLTAATNTIQVLTVTGNERLSLGQRLGLDFTGTLTGLNGLVVQIRLKRLAKIQN